ncbi:MAG: response regulator [Candidatus Paceibacterota bacterium]|jgi:CheY-like chemotaxis protein
MSAEKKSVLITDDDKFLSDMYSIKFSENGFEVKVASSGAACIALVEGGFHPDIFLCDIIMQEMDGFQLIENLKTKNLIGEGIVIVLSNLGQREDVEKGLSVGADGYIVKANATPTEVVTKVQEIIANKKSKK